MNSHPLFNCVCRHPLLLRAAGVLVALAWSTLAFCGEIHDAAKNGDLEKVEALLKKNPGLVFSKDNSGTTPLHLAAGYGHKALAQLLLTNNAKVNAQAKTGDTALHLAAFHGHKALWNCCWPVKPRSMPRTKLA